MKISQRLAAIKESPTLAMSARAAQLKAAGQAVIGLSAGEPDFDTPVQIKEAAIQAIASGFTKYTAVGGIPSLKQAIVDKFGRENQLTYALSEVTVSAGAKQALFNLMLSLLDAGDEVIIPTPCWVSYADIVKIAQGRPVFLDCSIHQQFKLLPAQLAAAISDETRLLVLNSPSNPTGAAYTLGELQALGEVLLRYPQVVIVTDDIYEHLNLSDHPFVNILNATPALRERTVVINGVSKAYAMTGWRIGYAAAPAAVIKAMEVVQSQSTTNPTSISQIAAQTALTMDQHCVKTMVAAYRERHHMVLERLNKISGLRCLAAQGGFYVFPDASEAIDRLARAAKIPSATDEALVEYLLQTVGVAVVAGSAFEAPNFFRLSFATSLEQLQEALQRIQRALA